jgi:hypothetical protein
MPHLRLTESAFRDSQVIQMHMKVSKDLFYLSMCRFLQCEADCIALGSGAEKKAAKNVK